MPDGLLSKLQVRPGSRLKLLETPPEIAAQLAGEGAQLVDESAQCEAVVAFCNGPADVARLRYQAISGLQDDGLLWFAYRKGAAGKTSGLTRDQGWDPLVDAGYTTVRSIAIDVNWTGLRFRLARLVKPRA